MLINQMPGLALDTTTATAGKIFNGYTAYNGDGELITGTAMATSITGVASDVLNGKTVYNQNGEVVTGSMTNNGSYTATTSYGGSTTIPAGYHNGSGYITGGSFNFSGATATADKILSGYKAYGSGGSLLTGTASAGIKSNVAYYSFSGAARNLITFETRFKCSHFVCFLGNIAESTDIAVYNGTGPILCCSNLNMPDGSYNYGNTIWVMSSYANVNTAHNKFSYTIESSSITIQSTSSNYKFIAGPSKTTTYFCVYFDQYPYTPS